MKSTYYFAGEAEQSSTTLTLAGPYKGRYYKQDGVGVGVGVGVWSACGGEAVLSVNSEVGIAPVATGAEGVLAATRESVRVSSSLYVQWRKC